MKADRQQGWRDTEEKGCGKTREMVCVDDRNCMENNWEHLGIGIGGRAGEGRAKDG